MGDMGVCVCVWWGKLTHLLLLLCARGRDGFFWTKESVTTLLPKCRPAFKKNIDCFPALVMLRGRIFVRR